MPMWHNLFMPMSQLSDVCAFVFRGVIVLSGRHNRGLRKARAVISGRYRPGWSGGLSWQGSPCPDVGV